MAISQNEAKTFALRDKLKDGILPLKETLQLCVDIVNSLAKQHQKNPLYGYLNPDTILLDKDGNISFDAVIGQRLLYISPEQTGRVSHTPGSRSDLYTIGVIMYEMLTGRCPFKGADDMEIVHGHIALNPASPAQINPGVPAVLSEIILKLLEKTPDERYQTASGLSYDLSKCLSMLQEKGVVTSFVLCEMDIPDHLSIPQKLYGRKKETAEMLEGYEAVRSNRTQILFVSGYSGIGKSALVKNFQKDIVALGGLFVSGKYDQFHRDIPYSALLQALKQWIGFVLSRSTEEIALWSKTIIAALGDGASVLTLLVPELELITGKLPPAPELSAAESQNRFQLLVLRLITAGATGAQPLVIFVDDLQWADIPSLKVLQFIAADTSPKKLYIIGSYRSNEVSDTHPVMAALTEMRSNVPLREICLTELDQDCVTEFVSAILHEPLEECIELSSLIYSKTAGNPFFTNEFIKSLANDKLISFSYEKKKWVWDTSKIRNSNITDNVVDLMLSRLSKLPPATIEATRLAACLGNTFSLKMLALVNGKTEDEVAEALGPIIAEGLVMPFRSNVKEHTESYSFLHDRVQQAAISTVPAEARPGIHLSAARTMYQHYNGQVPQHAIFDVVNQYYQAMPLIEGEPEKMAASKLAFSAGLRAKASAAFEPAYRYFRMALSLSDIDRLWGSDYSFALTLSNEAAEMAYLSGDVDTMELLTKQVVSKSKTVHDRVRAYNVRIIAYTSLTKNVEALQQCLFILNELGLRFPAKPNKLHIIGALLRTKMRLSGKPEQYFVDIPAMTDQHMLAIMDILAALVSSAYFVSPNLFPLVVFRQIEISLKYGISRQSPFAFSTYGIIMCGSTQEFEEGRKYASVANKLAEKHAFKDQESKLAFVEENFIRHWSKPYIEMAAGALRGFQSGLDTGEFLYVGYNAFTYSNATFYSGHYLPDVNEDHVKYVATLRSLKQNTALGWISVFKQVISNLSDSSVRIPLVGDDYDEETMIPAQEKNNESSGLCVVWLCKAMIAYLLDEKPGPALQYITNSEKYLENILATPHVVHVHFYAALINLRFAATVSGNQKSAALKKVAGIHKKFKKWAISEPNNLAAKTSLIEAEMARVSDKGNAEAFYLDAANKARVSGYINEEALAYELLAKYYLSKGQDKPADFPLTEAAKLYTKWGATAKIIQMQGLYPQLNVKNVAGDTGGNGGMLDLQSILKASQTISGEVQLASLLQKLSNIIIENAGATFGAILLKRKDGEWGVAAQAGSNTSVNTVYKDYLPIINDNIVANSVVNYVLSTRETITLHDARIEEVFMHDPFITANAVRSVLCFPVLQGGEIIAIIYLQNTLVDGAFTKDRLQAIKLLSGQIAISIQNSLLYDVLEQKVEERTAQLQAEKKISDDLLLNILPAEVAEELKRKGEIEAHQYDHVSVLFTDFVNFTNASDQLTPQALVKELHECFTAFDNIIEKTGLEKIKTIGDAYMAVCGLPAEDPEHANKTVLAALSIRDFMIERNKQHATFEVRIGINSGPVVAGIVGVKKFAYDIWGDTVNTAARMEQNSEPGKINISQTTYELVKSKFNCKYRGEINAKGKGHLVMYYVE